ncbi:hypothetical protein [Glycomyces buryatensis]|uniref:Uncharacterized protein n=1 Tax=Glycomyces buryatensis TaxID=2570927 RepID=A0A4S8QAN7_9ACTN|nr:hypothetical protein [Glycomyces buryatensis]THV41330.1 hypothetical protein FAB82_12285 [Glycomyces buryatensis]
MEPLAIMALQLSNIEARSALPDAPVVEDRPSRLSKLTGGVTSARRSLIGRHLAAPARMPRPEVGRAA